MDRSTGKIERIAALDGIKAYSVIGIVFMHVLANGEYHLKGFLFESLIPAFTDLVFLFMTVSAFGMCWGYFYKISKGEIKPEEFYKRRILKLWPFFALLCILEFTISPSENSFKELFADLTLCFGFLPDPGSISVVGVGWFIGLIFVFYLIFPFFCFLLENKRRAWSAFIISILFNLIGSDYFGIGRANILYSAPLFLGGGIVFLYREQLLEIKERNRLAILILCAAAVILYFLTGRHYCTIIIVSILFLIYALCGIKHPFLANKITVFLSGISFEIYLCHMPVYRVFERLGLLHVFRSEALSYLLTVLLTVAGAAVFANVSQHLINRSIALCLKKSSTEL